MSTDIGLIGLAVMGENLVLNMESHGFTVAVYNRTTARVDEFVNGRGKGLKVRLRGKFSGVKGPYLPIPAPLAALSMLRGV